MVIGQRARFGRLLLFAALLFGIAMMHTMGHPMPRHDDGPPGHAAPSKDHAARATMTDLAAQARVTDAAAPADMHRATSPANATAQAARATTEPAALAAELGAVAPANATAQAARAPVADATDPAAVGHPHGAHLGADLPHAGPELPGIGSDPMTVCLAVLDTVTLVVPAAGLLRTGPGSLPAGCQARILRALRTDPPPSKTLLARLSVLRI